MEDSAIIGPEAGVKVNLAQNTFLYAQVGYDQDTRNVFNKGIVNGSLGVGLRF